MKWFLISLAIGLAASDKLDRTYLPPPGAQFSGGILGHHDAPLEPPHHTPSGKGPIIGGHEGSQRNFGINGEPVNFGDKIPKVPVTTTSYAFSQTTTYPRGEGFETTALPINPITGMPIQFGQENYPNGPFPGQQNIFNLPSITASQAPTFGTNIQPGFGPQGPTSAPTNNGKPGYDQFANQPLDQYPGKNVITPGSAAQNSGSVYPGQHQGQLQYPKGQDNAEQQGFLLTGAPDNQHLDQYPGQNIVNPEGVVQIPRAGGQIVIGQQGFEPSTGSPISLNQNGINDDGAKVLISQGTYTGQPINVPTLSGSEPTQTTYQRQYPINVGGSPSQYPNGNQNYGSSVPTGSKNVYQSGSTPSTIPSSYNNGVSSSTPSLGIPSSTTSYSSVEPVYRPERLQAAADRNAVILNYENVRTPNGYSYSFDTSNGIHADESGIVDNGTKAQGSYSYIGDDGKVYSVIYTADENGFQPRGDHLPTPPPIPEAIQRVIEQAAKDKAAGIVHDGSYDEAKYGDKQYQGGSATHRRPQKPNTIQFGNDQFNEAKDDIIKPIVGIKDVEYDEVISQDHLNNHVPVTSTRKDTNGKLPARRPLNQINSKNNVQDVSKGNRRVSGDFDSPKGTFDGNSMPLVEEIINQRNDYGTKKQGSSRDRPMSNGNNQSFNQNNQAGSDNPGPSTRPLSSGVSDVTDKYPGSNVDVPASDFSGSERHEFQNGEGQTISVGSPNVSDRSGETVNSSFDSVTGAPIAGNKKQMLRQRIKGNRGPGSTGTGHNENKNSRPQDETYTQEITETPSFGEYFKNAIKNYQSTPQDDTGYHYQQPNNKFEQNTFPTRFSSQEVSSTMKPDQRGTEYLESTLRPFMTPNIYNKSIKNGQTTAGGNNQNNINSQSTTRRPFTTIGVNSPTDNSYTDYDDGDDYATDQDIGDDRYSSNSYPAEKGSVTTRPYQPTQTTSRPQNVPRGQITHANKKGTVTPGRRTETSGTVSPGYIYGPTTQMPSHNSRFGSTEFPLRTKPQQRRPSATVFDSTTAVGSPVTTQSPLGARPTDYKYQTTGPDSKYSGTNLGSGYPTTGSFPGSGSMLTTPGVSTPQDYYTSTYGPIQGYHSTTAVSPTYGYTQGSGSQVPSGTPGSYQLSQDNTFQTGYHYGPPKSGPINLDGPGFFTPSTNSGIFPTSPTGTYQTSYNQGSGSFPSTTLVPVTSEQQGTFIPSQPSSTAPEISPFGTYQGNYKNDPSTPDYATTTISSTPGRKPVFQYPGSSGAQENNGANEYGHTRPTYSTTDSPSTIGTTPGPFIPSEFTGPSQGYSTTYRPGFQTTKHTLVDGPVDGFGRPIITEQGGSHPGHGHTTQGITGAVNNTGPNFGGTDQSTKYPYSYDQTRVIGEDFSGPKQPQRFDPKTGYHY